MLLKADGLQEFVCARGRILVPDPVSGGGLSIFEEEIPREGMRVTRTYQLARWQDGSTHLWIGRRNVVGSGEGSSGTAVPYGFASVPCAFSSDCRMKGSADAPRLFEIPMNWS